MAANLFKLARILEGMNQLELAARAGIHVTVVSQLENGWRVPTPDQLKKLKRVLPRLQKAERLMR